MVIHLVTVSVNFCQVDRKNSYFVSQTVLLEGTVKGLEYQIATFTYVQGNLNCLLQHAICNFITHTTMTYLRLKAKVLISEAGLSKTILIVET